MENNSKPAKSQPVNSEPAKPQPFNSEPAKPQSCNAARIQELASQFKGRWGFLRYLTGLGFSIYNEYKNKFSVDVYQKLFLYLLNKDGFKAELNASLPMYWKDEQIGATCDVPFLIADKVIMDIYAIEHIDKDQQQLLKNRMKLTHTPYGMICNFDKNILYTEKYVRDIATGIIDRL